MTVIARPLRMIVRLRKEAHEWRVAAIPNSCKDDHRSIQSNW
jgi:hypothetical protein